MEGKKILFISTNIYPIIGGDTTSVQEPDNNSVKAGNDQISVTSAFVTNLPDNNANGQYYYSIQLSSATSSDGMLTFMREVPATSTTWPPPTTIRMWWPLFPAICATLDHFWTNVSASTASLTIDHGYPAAVTINTVTNNSVVLVCFDLPVIFASRGLHVTDGILLASPGSFWLTYPYLLNPPGLGRRWLLKSKLAIPVNFAVKRLMVQVVRK